MERFEKDKDERWERELNLRLEKLLDLLDDNSECKQRAKLIEKILEVYDELRVEACEYDEVDYKAKKEELVRIRYEIMQKRYNEDIESKSWNEFRDEEQGMEEEER